MYPRTPPAGRAAVRSPNPKQGYRQDQEELGLTGLSGKFAMSITFTFPLTEASKSDLLKHLPKLQSDRFTLI